MMHGVMGVTYVLKEWDFVRSHKIYMRFVRTLAIAREQNWVMFTYMRDVSCIATIINHVVTMGFVAWQWN